MATPDIIVQLKGGGGTTVVSPSATAAARLSELVDVDSATIADGLVLAWSAANGKFQCVQINGGTF